MMSRAFRRFFDQPVYVHGAAAVAVALVLITTTVVAVAAEDRSAGRIAAPAVEVRAESATTTTTLVASTTTTSSTSTTTTTTTVAPAPPGGPLTPLVIAPAQNQGYDRDLFGDWIDADRDCQNTRAEVLIEESAVPVTFTTAGSCTVATGQWVDPWTGVSTTTARDFDVDHTVPLANAWRSGAWAWTAEQRVTFANDLSYGAHLIAMDASANRSKGDRGPEGWRPPRHETWCLYAIVWTEIKGRWNLTATEAEWDALVEMASTC